MSAETRARRRQARPLFSPSIHPSSTITAVIDGAARGNPGPAAYGVVFKDAAGKVRARLSGRIGKTTNNVAEYRALLAALTYAHQQGWRALKVLTDSELLARQLEGSYKVRSAELKPLFQQAQQHIAALDSFSVAAVPRPQTREADRLANAALDARPTAATPRAKGESRSAGRPVKKTPPSPVAPATGRVRAVYEAGVLKPLVPLLLTEGEEVELEFKRVSPGRAVGSQGRKFAPHKDPESSQ